MTRENVLKIARACNMKLIGKDDCVTLTMLTEQLEKFADIVQEFEREACAQTCENLSTASGVGPFYCARMIRLRSEEEAQ